MQLNRDYDTDLMFLGEIKSESWQLEAHKTAFAEYVAYAKWATDRLAELEPQVKALVSENKRNCYLTEQIEYLSDNGEPVDYAAVAEALPKPSEMVKEEFGGTPGRLPSALPVDVKIIHAAT